MKGNLCWELGECEMLNSGEVEPELTLQIMRGMSEPHTLKLQGNIAGIPVLALIDSGASHNFLSEDIANRLKMKGDKGNSFWVRLGDGRRRQTAGVCKAVTLSLEGMELLADFHIFPLGGVDVILGVSWLRTLGNVNFNWDALTMEFKYKGRKVKVRGVQKLDVVRQPETFQILFTEAGLWGLMLGSSQLQQQLSQEKQEERNLIATEIQDMMRKFEKVFEEPHGLPPPRKHEHKIQIKEGVNPINVRPYRYAHVQKNEMERMVKEMLEIGIIRVSHSPFSSPVILVKKKDGS